MFLANHETASQSVVTLPVMTLRLFRRLLLLITLATSAFALNPSLQISQYAHSAWRLQEGALNGAPLSIAQTSDGYLWIGTNVGLVRFDGMRFVPWNPPPGPRLLDSRIFSLLGARDGGLWIGTGYSVSLWKSGRLIDYPQVSGRIESLIEDSQGAMWLARTQMTDSLGPVCKGEHDDLHCYGAADKLPFPNAVHLAGSDSGELWVAGYSELSRWKPGTSQLYFPNISGRPEGFSLFKAIATAPDGSTWAARDQSGAPLRLEHYEHGLWSSRAFPEIPADNSDVTTLFIDHGNALWLGTAHHGLFRIQGNEIEHFGRSDGLSSDQVQRFYEDKEGTTWVLTSAGVDNFRDLKVISYSMREGLSDDSAVAVLAAHNGDVLAVNDFQTLEILRGNRLSAISGGHGLPGRHPTTFFEDHADRLWIGIDSDLWIYDHGSFRVIRHADGTSLGIVFSIGEDGQHNIWIRAGHNLDRINNYQIVQELTSPQISTSYILAGAPDEGAVLGLVSGDLLTYRNGKMQTIAAQETGNTQQIRDLLVDPDNSVWGTTVDELVRWKDGIRRNLSLRNGLPCDGIYALVKDNTGSIWLYAKCGLIEIQSAELEHWWTYPDSKVAFRLLDQFDGVQPGLTSLKPQASRSPDGRLWFANGRILQMLNPNAIQTNHIEPPVHIEQVVADRKSYSLDPGLRLPPNTRDIEIDYTALSFVAPQKVMFQYKLDGHDSTWQQAGVRRQAFYNDLGPGSYRFHVIACNNDGVWNKTGTALTFVIAPAFYQTLWFQLLLLIAGLAVLWTLYLLRIRQATAQIQMRLNERIGERERIARELHDTLLQGFQGLMLRFQATIDDLPQHQPARIEMERVMDRADEVLLEGRERVSALRAAAVYSHDLAQVIAKCGEELTAQHPVRFDLAIVGSPRPLDPMVLDEAFRIAREALANAFQHAEATKIEAEITYERATLRLQVRDDGCGIAQEILDSGRPGHWGLHGIRERAEAIGGHLNIWSEAGAGTEIDLTIPAKAAYLRNTEVSNWGWFKRVLKRKKEQHGAGK